MRDNCAAGSWRLRALLQQVQAPTPNFTTVFRLHDALCSSSASPDVYATGGYDHIAKLWDMRAGQPAQSRDCGHPVEDVILLPSGAVMVTAAQNEIRFWSVLGGGAGGCMSCCINHQKTVTCLKYDGSQIGGGGQPAEEC